MTEPKSRASNGRSSIYQSDDGRWHGWVTIGVKANGTPDRRHRVGKTQKALTAKVRKLERERDAGTVLDPGRPPTVEEWLTHWVQFVAKPAVRPKTFTGYEVDVRVHAIPRLGAHRLDRLQPEHIDALFATMSGNGSSPGTVDHVRRTLVTAFNAAVARGRLNRNPAKIAATPRQEAVEVEPLSTEDARALLTAAADERNGTAWIIAVSLGLRRGEVLALRWTDFDAEEGTLTVRRALSRRTWQHGCADEPCGRKRGCDCPERHGGGLVFDEPKTGAGRRTLALPAPLVDALRFHRQRQLEERLRAGDQWNDFGLIFAQATGQPLDPDGHTKGWNTFLERTGVRPARLHDARHTAATLLLLQGVDPRTVLDIMGWSHLSMTKRYQHVVPALRRAAADKMTAILWDEPATATATTTATTRRRPRNH